MSYTARQKAIAIAPKFTSLASVFGSTFIIQAIVRDKRKMATPFHRILLGMCLTDAMSSMWFFLGTWPIPKGTVGVWGAVGNENTCIAQGFFSQVSLTTAMYNASLSVFYLLQIRYGWKNKQIRRNAEPFLHGTAIAIGIGTALAAVPLNLYNNDYWECWISPLPTDCRESWKNGGETDCIRGNNASLYRWVFYYGPLWAAIVAVTICMFLVYRSVLLKEKSMDQYDPQHEHKFSKKVAVQGFWYCGAFYATWILPTITRLTQLIVGDATPFWLICLTATFVPIQGSLNFVVYIRPRYKKYRLLRALVERTKAVCNCISCGNRRSSAAEEDGGGSVVRFSSLFYSRNPNRHSCPSYDDARSVSDIDNNLESKYSYHPNLHLRSFSDDACSNTGIDNTMTLIPEASQEDSTRGILKQNEGKEHEDDVEANSRL